ncbi:PREDICTED: glutelin type-B 5-like [Nelumbo nucifera]|nr:PREDICTED: glutelin type-B 5-like [Nelumbo nucifera]
MIKSALLPLFLSFLVLCHGCVAYRHQQQQHQWQGQHQQQHRFRGQRECQLQDFSALEPSTRIESEGGVTEYWEENNQQLNCAGVAVIRHVIEPKGLLLPSYTNAPKLTYFVQGRGFTGVVFPGCPETYQSFQQSKGKGGSRRYEDFHQKIRNFHQGDVIAYPTGVAHWWYNDGDTPVVAVTVIDTSNNANQLDQNLRKFQLAGNQENQQENTSQQKSTNNIFSGFDTETLAEAFGVSTKTARKLQGHDDDRGEIVLVNDGLQVIRPPRSQEQREEEEEKQQQQSRDNGLEEAFCNMRLRENIEDPYRADVYSFKGGRLSRLNSQNLPILHHLQLSAEMGVLNKNSILTPHWNMNAHAVVYVTRGSARCQIVEENGRLVFDDELSEGQLLVVPQNFVVLTQAGNEGFRWISFKTSDNARRSSLSGRNSIMRAMPEEVLMNSYQMSREEARNLKYNQEQMEVFSSRSRSKRQSSS